MLEQVGASCICCWRPMHHLPPSRFATTVPNATLVALQDLERPNTFSMLRSVSLSRVFGHVFLEPGWHLVIKREPKSHATRSEMTLTYSESDSERAACETSNLTAIDTARQRSLSLLVVVGVVFENGSDTIRQRCLCCC